MKKPGAKAKANTKAQEVVPKKAPSAAKTDEIDEVCDLFRRERWLWLTLQKIFSKPKKQAVEDTGDAPKGKGKSEKKAASDGSHSQGKAKSAKGGDGGKGTKNTDIAKKAEGKAKKPGTYSAD